MCDYSFNLISSNMISVYLYLAHFKVGLLTYLTLEFKLKGREHTREDKRKRERGGGLFRRLGGCRGAPQTAGAHAAAAGDAVSNIADALHTATILLVQ